MNDLNDKIYIILDDLRETLVDAVIQENEESVTECRKCIMLLEAYLNRKVSYADILPILLQICIFRYDLLKALELNSKKYAIFTINNTWISFQIDDRELLPYWKDVKQLEKEQEQQYEQIAISSSRYVSDMILERQSIIEKLKDFYINPSKHKFDYIDDILHIGDIFVTPMGEYSTGEWHLSDENYYEVLPEEIKKKNRAFYLVNNTKGKKIN